MTSRFNNTRDRRRAQQAGRAIAEMLRERRTIATNATTSPAPVPSAGAATGTAVDSHPAAAVPPHRGDRR